MISCFAFDRDISSFLGTKRPELAHSAIHRTGWIWAIAMQAFRV